MQEYMIHPIASHPDIKLNSFDIVKKGGILSYRRVVITDYGGRDVLKLIEESGLPEPKFNEVRIKVQAAGVAFTDVMIREGKYPEVKEKPPFSLGYDMVGVIDKLGDGAAKFKIGQRVADMTVIGAYSEYICLHEDRLVAVPEELDSSEAVSVILSYLTAYQMLHRVANIKRGQRILVHGAGGAVGTALVQLGRLHDLEIYGTASKTKHEVVSGLGATPIDYKSEDFVERIKSSTDDGVDAVFDHIGGTHLKRSFNVLKPKGFLVAYGFYDAVIGKGGSIPFDFLKIKLWNILPNGRTALFFSIGKMRKTHPDWFTEDLTKLFAFLEQGKIKPVIFNRMPLEEVKQAHELIENAQAQGKIILNLS